MLYYKTLDDVGRAQLDQLLDDAFGPGRKTKISYRFRDGVDEARELSLSVWDGARLVGSIQYWPIHVAGVRAVLLGPVAVAAEMRGLGLSRRLIHQSLDLVTEAGFDLVVLVGDPQMYRKYGFSPAGLMGLEIAGEEARRVQARALTPAGLDATGPVEVHRAGENSPLG